jgi:hypothetical protein
MACNGNARVCFVIDNNYMLIFLKVVGDPFVSPFLAILLSIGIFQVA